MAITSVENEKIKNLVKLQKKKYRDLSGTYVVEGYHLIEEAYKAGVVLEIFLVEGETVPFEVPCTFVSTEVMKKVSTLDTPSTMIAVCRKKKFSDIKNHNVLLDKVLLLDEIQDPGNLGTIIRSSVAFGINMIILSENTVDLYNPKVLRATQGMYCHIPIIRMDSQEAILKMKESDFTIYGTNVTNGTDIAKLSDEEKKKWCLIMGNEGNGVKEEIQALCDKNLYISMNSNVESLNVGVACSILLYEFRR